MTSSRVVWIALFSGLLLGCGESPQGSGPRDPVAPPMQQDFLSPPPVGLLSCSPLPYDSTTETIGPDGGVLQVGPHRLFIPAGALTDTVTITAVAPSDTVNRVQLQPEGLQFSRPAWLNMSYANCSLLGQLLPKRVAYTTDALVILEYLLSFDNFFTQRVTGRVNHFSNYAIAW